VACLCVIDGRTDGRTDGGRIVRLSSSVARHVAAAPSAADSCTSRVASGGRREPSCRAIRPSTRRTQASSRPTPPTPRPPAACPVVTSTCRRREPPPPGPGLESEHGPTHLRVVISALSAAAAVQGSSCGAVSGHLPPPPPPS